MDLEHALDLLRQVAARQLGLRLLLLHGSRSRQQEHAGSDWDLAYLGEPTLDVETLRVDVTRALATDRVDLADLVRASALMRFQAASHGLCVYEAEAGVHEAFVLEATLYWCDVEWVLRRAHADVLAGLSS